jgi:hypothetical protein
MVEVEPAEEAPRHLLQETVKQILEEEGGAGQIPHLPQLVMGVPAVAV